MYIEGRIVKIFYSNARWFSGLISRNRKNEKVAGDINRRPYEGMWLEGEAELVDEGYGDQWSPDSYFSVRTVDKRSYMSLMCSGEFIFMDYDSAERVWRFVNGNLKGLIQNLQKTPHVLKNACNLSDEQITDLFRALVLSDQYERLLQLFPSLTKNTAKNLVEYSHMDLDTVINFLRSNPYRLVGIKGVRFDMMDKVAIQDDKISLDDVTRMYYVIHYTLKKFMDTYGCTYLNLSNQDECYYAGYYRHPYYTSGSFYQMLCSNSKVPMSPNFNETRLRQLFVYYQSGKFKPDKSSYSMNFERVQMEQDVGGSVVSFTELHLYTSDLYNSQRELAGVFKRVCSVNAANSSFYADSLAGLKDYLQLHHTDLTSEQLRGVKNAFSNRVSIITGGPGRGKTHILEELVPMWETIHGQGTVMGIGPTGRSVKCMKEKGGCEESQTAARCLISNGYHFDHYVEIPYNVESIHGINSFQDFKITQNSLIIIDESSMVDFVLAGNLLKLLEGATIVFMGDVDQLQPVSPGCFFYELINSGVVPVTMLTKNLRANYSEIVDNADAIINGTFDLSNKKNFTMNFMLMPFDSDLNTQSQILSWYQTYLADGAEHSDILIMSPIHRGPAGVDGLNIMFQNYLNPISQASLKPVPDTNYGSLPFLQHKGCVCEDFVIRYEKDANNKKVPCCIRVGDRLMVVKNDTEISLKVYEDDDPDGEFIQIKPGVFNGDIGTVRRYYPAGGVDAVSYAMIQMDDGRCLYIDSDNFTESKMFELGYAFTIHKAQGSEAKHVIFSVPQRCGSFSSPLNPFFTQNLIYTACTRAKDSVLIIGDANALARGIATPVHYHNVELSRFLNN